MCIVLCLKRDLLVIYCKRTTATACSQCVDDKKDVPRPFGEASGIFSFYKRNKQKQHVGRYAFIYYAYQTHIPFLSFLELSQCLSTSEKFRKCNFIFNPKNVSPLHRCRGYNKLNELVTTVLSVFS